MQNGKSWRSWPALILLALPAASWATNLDITSSYEMQALSYSNLNINPSNRNDQSFISNDASMGFSVHDMDLQSVTGGHEASMDLGVMFRAVGVTGSTATLGVPFDRAANMYPSASFIPFFENAYFRLKHLFGSSWEMTFGRQNFMVGSGLLLSDDGAGLTGVTAKGDLPFWDMQMAAFIFNDRSEFLSAPDSEDYGGISINLPTDGAWELNELLERDHVANSAFSCPYSDDANDSGCAVRRALKSFTSIRYQLSYGPMVFDGEAAIERGNSTLAALPGAAAPDIPGHVAFTGNAAVLRAKWKQRLFKVGEGIAHLSFAHGSGANPGDQGAAFMPAHGHQYDGLERDGFGDFFGATPYSALGGGYNNANSLRSGVSGVNVVGAGYTPPAYYGVALDVSYYFFQADKVVSGSKALGREWDFRLRHNVGDSLTLSAGAALFSAGDASNPVIGQRGGVARKFTFLASAKF